MFTFLLVVHAIIAAALVAVILMQRSEGGGLGMGGSPSGLMSARGAADFLTRATTVLATLFVAMCVFLAVLAANRSGPAALDSSLVRTPATPGAPLAPAPVPTTDPLANGNAAAPALPVAPVPPPPVTRASETKAPAAKAEKKAATPAPASANTAAPKIAPPPVVTTTPAPANGATPPQ